MSQTYTSEDILAKLVGFPTVSSQSNLNLIGYIEDYLGSFGIESTRVPDATGQKASLYAQIGPAEPGGVILSGHTDVVPVDGQNWATDPFSLTEKQGRLYGRGTCDMKGFAAVALAAVPDMLAAGIKRPIQLALSYDEEVGCLGAPPLIERMRANLPPASAAIIGEPTMMHVVTGHKGIMDIETTVTGFEVHSSLMHTGVPAIMVAARLIEWQRLQNDRNAAHAPAAADDIEGAEFTPPWTTLHTGVIQGGTAGNITSRTCTFTTDIRLIPSESKETWLDRYRRYAAELEAEIRTIRPEASIDIQVKSSVPGCKPEKDGAAEALARQLTGDNGQHVVSYATEAGQFQDGAYSAVVCGPGSIEQAHQPNEFISKDQLRAGDAFLSRLIDHLSR